MGKKATTADLERRLDEVVAELARLEGDAKNAHHLMVGNLNQALAHLRASQKAR
jgi:hypothetical protein